MVMKNNTNVIAKEKKRKRRFDKRGKKTPKEIVEHKEALNMKMKKKLAYYKLAIKQSLQ